MKRLKDNIKPISEILNSKFFTGTFEPKPETKKENCFCPSCLAYQLPDDFEKIDLDFNIKYRFTCSICSQEFTFIKKII